MKKLVYGAAMAVMAGSAWAQSSVTLFGVVDTNLAIGRGSISDRQQISNSGSATSRLGFRGVEDLGGGMSASFWLESGLNTDDGSGQGTTNPNNQVPAAAPVPPVGLMFARRATVGLAGTWGEVRLGRDYVPQYWNLYFADPFGNVGVGLPMTATYVFLRNAAGPTGIRASNMVAYFTPPGLAGWFGHAAYYLGENPKNGAPTEDDGTGGGIRIGYSSGPFYAAIATGRTSFAAGDTRQTNAVATWDFKVAKVGLQVSRDRNGPVEGRGWLLGGWVPVGAGQVLASYSRYRSTAAGNPEGRKVALGYIHFLSKRTALYTTLARLKNGGGAAIGLNGSATAPNTASTGMDLGIRHNF